MYRFRYFTLISYSYNQGCGILVFCCTPQSENLGLQTPIAALKTWTLTPTLGPKSDSDSRTYCVT